MKLIFSSLTQTFTPQGHNLNSVSKRSFARNIANSAVQGLYKNLVILWPLSDKIIFRRLSGWFQIAKKHVHILSSILLSNLDTKTIFPKACSNGQYQELEGKCFLLNKLGKYRVKQS